MSYTDESLRTANTYCNRIFKATAAVATTEAKQRKQNRKKTERKLNSRLLSNTPNLWLYRPAGHFNDSLPVMRQAHHTQARRKPDTQEMSAGKRLWGGLGARQTAHKATGLWWHSHLPCASIYIKVTLRDKSQEHTNKCYWTCLTTRRPHQKLSGPIRGSTSTMKWDAIDYTNRKPFAFCRL